MSGQSPSTSPSSNATGSSAGNSIQGCLDGSAGKFTIIDKAGVTYNLIIPARADTSKLNQHIGQEVAVTGTVTNANGSEANGASAASSPSASDSSAADSSASGSTGAGASSTSSAQPSIQVQKIDKVADTCSTNSTPAPSSH
jgi:hypothetical protein